MPGGLAIYRATAECSACGKVADIGPFDELSKAVAINLGGIAGWLLPSGPWMLRDQTGMPFTICDRCMARPVVDVLADVTARAASIPEAAGARP